MEKESEKENDDSQKLMEQLKYSVFYKRRDLEFAIVNNSSKHRALEKNLDFSSMGFKVPFILFVSLLILGRVFVSLIRVGNSFVTSAFGLLYFICGIFYFGAMLALFIKTIDSFWLWFENSDTKWGNEYCKRKELFTLSMEQEECARLLVRYHNYIGILDEIDEKMEGQASTDQLSEWLQQVEAMEIQPETKREKRPSLQQGKWKRTIFSVILFLILINFLF